MTRPLSRGLQWRVVRWTCVAVGTAFLFACNSHSLEPPTITPTETQQHTFQETLNRKIDILFMIDDSSSMETAQANLKTNLSSFMDVLKQLPGGLPDLHIAVVTSDMGAGDGSINGCGGNGDNGVFRSNPTGGCTATTLQAGATFITDTGGTAPQTNFTDPDITNVFKCIAVTGATGCGFEHQLASVARALGADGFAPPQENQGFLRPEAYLAIVLVTNEDDCSAPVTSPIYGVSTMLSSMYGPTENFICNEWGHLCSLNGGAAMKPSRYAPNNLATDMVTYSPAGGPNNCTSAEGQGLLTPVGAGGFADGIKALKADPASQILVAAIAGPSTPYIVHWRAPPVADTGPWPELAHSCGSEADPASFADPGVRLQQFVDQFGGNGLTYPFCSTNYGPALNTIATKLSALLGPKCIGGTVATRPNSQTFDCTVTDLVPNSTGGTVQAVVPACADNGNMPPCWDLTVPTAGQACPANAHVVTVNRGTAMPADNLRSAVECSMCIAGHPDSTRGCP